MKPICVTFIVLTTLILVLYPFVLTANIMALAAYPASQPPVAVPLSALIFMWTSALYPLPWLVSLVASLWYFRKNIRTAVIWQAVLCVYLGLVTFSGLAWIFYQV